MQNELESVSNINKELEVEPDFKSAMYWRRILKGYRSARLDLEEQKKIKKEVLDEYTRDLEKRTLNLESIENHLKMNMHLFAKKTKSGGLKIDQFPDVGTLSLSKAKETLTPDPEYWITDFSKSTLKFDLSRFREVYDVIGGKITNTSTGEVVELPNVEISTKSSLIFRAKESNL